MAGTQIKIKRKSAALPARDVLVVKQPEGAPAETPARSAIAPGVRTSRIKAPRRAPDSALEPNTMKVVLKDEEEAPTAAAVPAAPEAPAAPVPAAEPPARPLPPPPEVLGEPTFKFYCYRCGQKLKVPVSWANKVYPCVRCGHDIIIPPPLVGAFW